MSYEEILEAYYRAAEEYTPEWEARTRSYNHRQAIRILESWKTIPQLIQKIDDLTEELKRSQQSPSAS